MASRFCRPDTLPEATVPCCSEVSPQPHCPPHDWVPGRAALPKPHAAAAAMRAILAWVSSLTRVHFSQHCWWSCPLKEKNYIVGLTEITSMTCPSFSRDPWVSWEVAEELDDRGLPSMGAFKEKVLSWYNWEVSGDLSFLWPGGSEFSWEWVYLREGLCLTRCDVKCPKHLALFINIK